MNNDAHAIDYFAQRFAPHSWMTHGQNEHQHCSYCGSVRPDQLAKAIKAGATLSLADFKYGWPHKAYIQGPKDMIKFYTTHLMDATPEDKAVIEREMGLTFQFLDDGQSVLWNFPSEAV